jgi:enamine deaminase RidA (YjgF/YER057c/UK114 family)
MRPSTARRQLVTSGSPFEAPIGFSRAVRAGDRVLVAGTAPVWPDGHVEPGAEAQARRCLEIIISALAEAGASAADVVRTRTFLVDAADWQAVGREHGRVFGDVRPASTMLVVKGLLDERWKVEIEAEAIVGSGVGLGDGSGASVGESSDAAGSGSDPAGSRSDPADHLQEGPLPI